jgi:hypothetical protein
MQADHPPFSGKQSMTGREAIHQAQHQALLKAQHKAAEKYAESAAGMQARAVHLRSEATAMTDTNDRDVMLRLAAGYEQRAANALRRQR